MLISTTQLQCILVIYSAVGINGYKNIGAHASQAKTLEAGAIGGSWIIDGDESFLVVSAERFSWNQARSFCQARGSDLAIPRNVNSLAERIRENGLPTNVCYWLGGSDENEEGRWYWFDGTKVTAEFYPDTYGKRKGPEPDDGLYPPYRDAGNDCLAFIPNNSGSGYLVDGSCEFWAQPFICE